MFDHRAEVVVVEAEAGRPASFLLSRKALKQPATANAAVKYGWSIRNRTKERFTFQKPEDRG